MNEIINYINVLKSALRDAETTIENLRTSNGAPCPKYCGDCSSVDLGCHILTTLGRIHRALDAPIPNINN